MNIDYFEEFAIVVKHGNLSEAAVELNITQSALSRHLAAIEKELGGELYDRTCTPMQLTPLGELVLKESNVIAIEWRRLRELAHKMRKEPVATIVIASMVDPVVGRIARRARELAADRGVRLKIKFERSSTHTPFHLVREGLADLAIEPMSGHIDVHDLVHRHVAFEDACLVVSPNNELSARPNIDVAEISRVRFVALRGNSEHAWRKHLQQLCETFGDNGSIPARFYASPSAATYDELFLGGLEDDAVMLPKSSAQRYADDECGDYVAVPVTGDGAAYDFHVFHAQGCSAQTAAFVDLLIEAAAELGYA